MPLLGRDFTDWSIYYTTSIGKNTYTMNLTTIRICIYTNTIRIVRDLSMNLPKQQENNTRIAVNNNSSPELIQTRKPPTKNKQVNKDQMQKVAVEIRFLALSWLDDFEKEVFDGKTVDELLNKGVYEEEKAGE